MPGTIAEWTPIAVPGLSASDAANAALLLTVLLLAGVFAWQRSARLDLLRRAWRDEAVASRFGVYRLRTSTLIAKTVASMAPAIGVISLCVVLACSAYPSAWPFGLGLIGGLASVAFVVRSAVDSVAPVFALPRRLGHEVHTGFRVASFSASVALVMPALVVSISVNSSFARAGELGLAGCLVGVSAASVVATLLLTRGDRFHTAGMKLWSRSGAHPDQPYEMILVGPEPEERPAQTLATQAALAAVGVSALVGVFVAVSGLLTVSILGPQYAAAALMPWIVAIPLVGALASWWTRRGVVDSSAGLMVSAVTVSALALSISAWVFSWFLPVSYDQAVGGPAWVQSLTGYVAASGAAMLVVGTLGGVAMLVCGQVISTNSSSGQKSQQGAQHSKWQVRSVVNGVVVCGVLALVFWAAYVASPTSELVGLYCAMALGGLAAPVFIGQSVATAHALVVGGDLAKVELRPTKSRRKAALTGYLTADRSMHFCGWALASAGLMWVFNPLVVDTSTARSPMASMATALGVLLLGIVLGGGGVVATYLVAQTLLRPYALIGVVVAATWILSVRSLDMTLIGFLAGAIAAVAVLQILQVRAASQFGVTSEQQRTAFRLLQRKDSASAVTWSVVILMGSIGVSAIQLAVVANAPGAQVSMRWSLLASLAIAALFISLMVSMYAARSTPQDVDEDDMQSVDSTEPVVEESRDKLAIAKRHRDESDHYCRVSRVSLTKVNVGEFPALEAKLEAIQSRLRRVNLRKNDDGKVGTVESNFGSNQLAKTSQGTGAAVGDVLDLDAEAAPTETDEHVTAQQQDEMTSKPCADNVQQCVDTDAAGAAADGESEVDQPTEVVSVLPERRRSYMTAVGAEAPAEVDCREDTLSDAEGSPDVTDADVVGIAASDVDTRQQDGPTPVLSAGAEGAAGNGGTADTEGGEGSEGVERIVLEDTEEAMTSISANLVGEDSELVCVDVAEAEEKALASSSTEHAHVAADQGEELVVSAGESSGMATSSVVSAVASNLTTTGHPAAESETPAVNTPLPNVPHCSGVPAEDSAQQKSAQLDSSMNVDASAGDTAVGGAADLHSEGANAGAEATAANVAFFGTHPDNQSEISLTPAADTEEPAVASLDEAAVAGVLSEVEKVQQAADRQCGALPNIPGQRRSGGDNTTSELAVNDVVVEAEDADHDDFSPISSGARPGQIDLTELVEEPAANESGRLEGVTTDSIGGADGRQQIAGFAGVITVTRDEDSTALDTGVSGAEESVATAHDSIHVPECDDQAVPSPAETPEPSVDVVDLELVTDEVEIEPHVADVEAAAVDTTGSTLGALRPIEPPAAAGPNAAVLQYKAVVSADDEVPHARPAVIDPLA